MSDAFKKLEEIEARLMAATPPDKWLDRHAKHINIGGSCWGSMTMDEADYVLAEHAPADLALLVSQVRALIDWGERVVSHCEHMNFNTREEEWISEELAEILRELSGGARSEA